MTSLLLQLIRTGLEWIFVVYTVVAVSHFVVQLFYAHRTYRRQRSPTFDAEHPDLPLAVDIVIPSYNEDPALLEACVRSALQQDHPGQVRVLVVDDGSPNRAALDPIYRALKQAGATIIRSAKNHGKRHAQSLAFRRSRGDVIVTLDSDSVLAPDAVRRLVRWFRDPKIGGVTGFVDVQNDRTNILTRLQRMRYWMAFNQERAAQSWFRTVLCLSGPLTAYRRTAIDQVRKAYLTQTYAGLPCTFGDDRHLTNLILDAGYDTTFDATAVAETHAPETWRQFLKQQLRWSKSFYRELIWTIPFIGRRSWYSRFDLACQAGMPLVLPVTATTALVVGSLSDPSHVFRYLGMIAGVGVIRATYGVIRHRDLRFYLFVAYGFVSAFVLAPLRFKALWTLADTKWGTRGPKSSAPGPWTRIGQVARRFAVTPAPLAFSISGAGPIHLQPRFGAAWGGTEILSRRNTPPRTLERAAPKHGGGSDPIPTAVAQPVPAWVGGPVTWPDPGAAWAPFEHRASARAVPGSRIAGDLPAAPRAPAGSAEHGCLGCGLPLSMSARFCRRCGAPQQVQAAH